MKVVIVAAVARNGVIGIGGRLPWRIPADLAHFKTMTMGGALVMGRSTFESIGRALPGRTTVVLTTNSQWSHENVETASSLEEALKIVENRGLDAFIAGGAEVYRSSLEVADRMELTEVDAEPEGDTWFPEVNWSEWSEIGREAHDGFSFVSYIRA